MVEQSVQLPPAQIEIRPDNPAETTRLREMLPRAFQETSSPALSIAAVGSVGRSVAAAAVISPLAATAGGGRTARLR